MSTILMKPCVSLLKTKLGIAVISAVVLGGAGFSYLVSTGIIELTVTEALTILPERLEVELSINESLSGFAWEVTNTSTAPVDGQILISHDCPAGVDFTPPEPFTMPPTSTRFFPMPITIGNSTPEGKCILERELKR